MDHEEIKALLPLAALDRLEPDEQRALDEHLGGCAECSTELAEFRETAAAIALALDDPAGAERRVWSRLAARLGPTQPDASERRERSVSRPARFWRPAALVMTSLAAAASIYALVVTAQRNRANAEKSQLAGLMNDQISRMREQISAAQNELVTFQRVLDDRLRLEKVLTQPDLQLTRLAPLKASPSNSSAIVAVSAANHTAMIQARGLPATPAGKTYELWWITKESGPVAAGLFRAADGEAVVAQASPPPRGEHVLATAVTLEPAGGVSKPTGEMYLKGTPG
jgi:anti-sigma-K factor RskA